MVERRLAWLAAIVTIWGAAIFYNLISLQIVHHGEYAAQARRRQEVSEEIAAPRGAILDRTGQPLALSIPAKSVSINPLQVDIENAAALLSRVLHLDREELQTRMKAYAAAHRGFMWVKRRIEPAELQTIRNLPVDYISVENESRRHYPNGDPRRARARLGGLGGKGQLRHRAGDGAGPARNAGQDARPDRREAPRHRIATGGGGAPGHAAHPHHRRPRAERSRARARPGRGKTQSHQRQRGGDESV